MKLISLFICGACFLAGALAAIDPNFNNMCLACMAPNNGLSNPAYCYKTNPATCEYKLDYSCDPGDMITSEYGCTQIASLEDTNCQSNVDAVTLASTETSIQLVLKDRSFCYISLTGNSKTLKVTFSSNMRAYDMVKQPTDWTDSNKIDYGTVISSQNSQIRIALINPTNNIKQFTLKGTDNGGGNNNNGGGGNNNNNGGSLTLRSGKCLSCLNPHESLSSDPVYYCTNTKTCESSAGTPSCPSITASKACTTSTDKKEDPACEIVNNVRFSKTAKTVALTLPSDSFCYITLIGVSKKMKISYSSGLSAVYYPVTGEWNSKTLQASGTDLSAATSTTNSRLLQGSTELKVAIVNYDPSNAITFTVEAEDPTVPDSEDRFSKGQIAGIVIGGIIFIVGLTQVIAWGVKSWKKRAFSEITKTEAKPINRPDVVDSSNE